MIDSLHHRMELRLIYFRIKLGVIISVKGNVALSAFLIGTPLINKSFSPTIVVILLIASIATGYLLAINQWVFAALAFALPIWLLLRPSPTLAVLESPSLPPQPLPDLAPEPIEVPQAVHAATPLRCRILMAEDNEINAIYARASLESAGFNVTVASDGHAAVELVRTGDFELVLMDCHMPGLDGYGATRRIRALEAGIASTRIPIIALTAGALIGDREKCLSAGMDDYLAKPFTRESLLGVVSRWRPMARMNTTALPSQGALDSTVISQLKSMDDTQPGFMRALTSSFVSSTPELIRQIEHSAARSNFAALKFHLHTLKSTSGQLGAAQLMALCDQIESQLDQGVPTNPAETFALLRKTYALTVAELEAVS